MNVRLKTVSSLAKPPPADVAVPEKIIRHAIADLEAVLTKLSNFQNCVLFACVSLAVNSGYMMLERCSCSKSHDKQSSL